jgi:hypothetical protein
VYFKKQLPIFSNSTLLYTYISLSLSFFKLVYTPIKLSIRESLIPWSTCFFRQIYSHWLSLTTNNPKAYIKSTCLDLRIVTYEKTHFSCEVFFTTSLVAMRSEQINGWPKDRNQLLIMVMPLYVSWQNFSQCETING